MLNDSEAQIVIDFVANFVGVDSTEISVSTKLREDLGLAGEDAVELFFEFSKRFKVDISAVNVVAVFGGEYPATFFGLLNNFLRKSRIDKSKGDVTVKELIEAVNVGRF